MHDSAREMAFSRAARVVSTATWTDTTTTPKLIRTIISMMYAAAYIRKSYSEALGSEVPSYAVWLEKTANDTLTGIISGDITLLELGSPVGSTSGPSFFPNDESNSLPVYNAQGDEVGVAGSNDAKFRMGTKW
jgi:hypothetical protein